MQQRQRFGNQCQTSIWISTLMLSSVTARVDFRDHINDILCRRDTQIMYYNRFHTITAHFLQKGTAKCAVGWMYEIY